MWAPFSCRALQTRHDNRGLALELDASLARNYMQGYVYRLRVKPGEEGKEQFRRQLHKITGTFPWDTFRTSAMVNGDATCSCLRNRGSKWL